MPTDQPITSLPVKTASSISAADYLLGIDSSEGYQMLIQDLGDYIIQHSTSSLLGATQTVADAFNSFIYAESIDDLSTKILALTSNRTYPVCITSTVVSTFTNGAASAAGKGFVFKSSNTVADVIFAVASQCSFWSVRFNPTAKTFTVVTQHPTRAEIGSTDISSIGNGTVTGAISWLNSNTYLLSSSSNVISANTDLNTVTSPGKYRCRTGNDAASLSNCPISIAFSMIVEVHTTGHIKQTIVYENSTTYTHTRVYASNTWSNWELIPNRSEIGTASISGIGDGSVTGAISTLNANQTPIELTSSDKLLTVALDSTVCPVNSIRYFNLRYADTSDLPVSTAIYCLATVNKRTASTAFVILYTESNIIYHNTYANGAWKGWIKINTGATDISSIGDGSITGAISILNAKMMNGTNDTFAHIAASYTGTESTKEERIVNAYNAIISSIQTQFTSIVDRVQFYGRLNLSGSPSKGTFLIWGTCGVNNGYGKYFATHYNNSSDEIFVVNKNSSASATITKMVTRSELGTTDISTIGDGTVTGAIAYLASQL